MLNDFQQCLDFSHSAHDLPLWREVYERAFPDMVGMHCHRADGDHQRLGIDRSIVLSTGKTLWIDEKVRKKNYSDIALEFVSNNRTNTPGWVCKKLMCDYIAYAIAPAGKCYLLPVVQLQSAWKTNQEQWRQQYQIISAINRGYCTLSCCIPPDVLFRKIGQ